LFRSVWGWRIPFALSIVLVGVGLWVRLGILETPVFQKLVAERRVEKAPIVEVIRRQPKEIMLSALARMAEQAPFYIFTAFVFSYATGTLKMSRDFVLEAVLAASLLAGGPAPLIATALFAAYHTGYAIAIYIAACAVVSLVAAALMPDYTGKDISAEYEL